MLWPEHGQDEGRRQVPDDGEQPVVLCGQGRLLPRRHVQDEREGRRELLRELCNDVGPGRQRGRPRRTVSDDERRKVGSELVLQTWRRLLWPRPELLRKEDSGLA